MRLIDADALKNRRTVLWDEALGHSACVLVEYIDEAPTVNAVVLPCKVGDTVYRKSVLTFQKETVIVIGFDDEGIYIGTTCGIYRKHHIGKTVFLTREEAEAALAERKEA